MARDHARIQVSVWDDTDFTSLGPVEQWVYFMLNSHRDLSYCGVIDYVPERFVGLAAGMSRKRFVQALGVLRDRAYVVVDERTAEILVRSYVRYDGLLKQPNVAKAMVKALHRTHSPVLREAVVTELARARGVSPGAPGWRGVENEDCDLFADICARAWPDPTSTGSAKGSPKGSANPSARPSGKGGANA